MIAFPFFRIMPRAKPPDNVPHVTLHQGLHGRPQWCDGSRLRGTAWASGVHCVFHPPAPETSRLFRMPDTYSQYAHICERFYDLSTDQKSAAGFVLTLLEARAGQRALFVGSMLGVAEHLVAHGLALTVVDHSEEMVELARRRLPGAVVRQADLRSLPFDACFDFVVVIGRVFTHLISEDDLTAGLHACRRAVAHAGVVLVDNYESGKILRTAYFNGAIQVRDERSRIVRRSTTELLTETPLVVRWKASYTGIHEGAPFSFDDTIEQRAWSRDEIHARMSSSGFSVLRQGDNFDDTSFYTLARAV
ncbi:MAG TPA: class I SAM-dependent methyltransferase [Noviherbaspirillum sp.]|jgi:SAM-dependent methyltransferase|uniref:class I SAM-dependent methyltransferase n=1 Tax=Noviherbaspirillum sp. TaxID=1926288 RepID=UPI002F956E0F